ncbi:tyrosine-protein kinase domain-containing protein [[Phormidium] sp. ETS-05]|uniref:GumC family protein n=1 Tax=[Phormidium] sp. ETS-05 TaxID=222819 RepID=UPI0018EF1BF5|nr:tyrosine-protein kinase domain-containing protein [[Phormidium] sp. ETS-05]
MTNDKGQGTNTMAPPIVKRYLIALPKYKWVGLGAFIVIMGASSAMTMKETPPITYDGRGFLSYNSNPVSFTKAGGDIQEQGRTILTKEILLDQNLIKAVAERVKIDAKRLRPPKSWVRPPEQEGAPPVIQVGYDGADTPQQAVEVTQALMEAMVEQSRQINSVRLKAVITALEKRLPEVEQKLKKAENNVEAYIRREGVKILAAKSGSLPGAIVANEEQQRQLRLNLEGIEAQIRSWEQRLGLTATQASVAQALSADPIIAQMRAQLQQTETQIELRAKDLRPAHPEMIQLRKQQESYEQLLEKRAAEVIGGNGIAAPLLGAAQIRKDSSLDPVRQQMAQNLIGLQTQRETLQQQLEMLKTTEQQLKRDYATIPNLELERQRLEQQVGLHKQLYDQIQGALADARAAEAETVPSLALSQPPYFSTKTPPSQNPLLTIILGGIMGMAVGNGLIFVLSLLEGKFYTMEEVRGALQGMDLRVLGVLPTVRTDMETALEEMPLLLDPDSPYLHFYEQMRLELKRGREKSIKVLLLTSTDRGEGKSFCAYNLAIAAARADKRTLVIEADLRSASNSHFLKVAPDPLAISEPLQYYGQLSRCIHLVPEVENLYIIPSPGKVRSSAAILESSEMRRILEDAKIRFDFVIIDAPALNVGNDVFLLEPYTDGMAIVTRVGHTMSGMLTEYVAPLTEAEDVQLLGAIINSADLAINMEEEEIPDLHSSLVEPSLLAPAPLGEMGTREQRNGMAGGWGTSGRGNHSSIAPPESPTLPVSGSPRPETPIPQKRHQI